MAPGATDELIAPGALIEIRGVENIFAVVDIVAIGAGIVVIAHEDQVAVLIIGASIRVVAVLVQCDEILDSRYPKLELLELFSECP